VFDLVRYQRRVHILVINLKMTKNDGIIYRTFASGKQQLHYLMLFKAYKSTETVAQLIKHTVALHLQHTYYNY